MESNTEQKFYRIKYSIEVLADSPIHQEPLGLEDLAYEITQGAYVGGELKVEATELTPAAMAKVLYEFGSEPGFFQLDDNGKSTE